MKVASISLLLRRVLLVLGPFIVACATKEPEPRPLAPAPQRSAAMTTVVPSPEASAVASAAPSAAPSPERPAKSSARAPQRAPSTSAQRPAKSSARAPQRAPSTSAQRPAKSSARAPERAPATSAIADAAAAGVMVSAQRWSQAWTECEGVHVYIVSLSPGHPERSAASLATTSDGRAQVRRPGQWIGEYEVLAITDDWTGMRPGVWLRRGTEVCRARLSGNPERVPPPPKKERKRKKKRRRAR